MTPLQRDVFYVDNTICELIQTCGWKAYAKVIRRRTAADDSSALRFGGFAHRVLAYRYKTSGFRKKWSEDTMLRIVSTLFNNNPLETEGWRNANNLAKVIQGYNAAYPQDNERPIALLPSTGRPAVEMPFAIDTHKVIRGRRIVYIGRIDRVECDYEGVCVVDTKTSSVGGTQFWDDQAITEQHRGYAWAYKQAAGQEPVGYKVDAIFARESIENAVFDPITGKVIPLSSKSKAVPLELAINPFFTKVPEGQLEEWFENMLSHVDNFLYQVDRGMFSRCHKNCVGKYGKCEFYNVCSQPADAREDALMSTAYKDNEWLPIFC